jgi:NAD-dependent dihydropyrimidine dehydrogenase PreA subunit
MGQPQRILYCHCAFYDVVPREVRRAVLARLAEACVPFEPVRDLCELAARREPRLKDVAGAGSVAVVACYPRAVRWLFDAAGAPLPEEGVALLNMRADAPEAIVEAALRGTEGACRCECGMNARVLESVLEVQGAPAWVPWFPVIDRDRCTGCRQCLDFCLFGVFGTDAQGRVVVEHPENCKTNCPACARVCPEAAIIFPKYTGAPINGAPVGAPGQAEPVQVDLAALVSGDLRAMLRERSESARRRSSEDRDPERAAAERARCACAADILARLGLGQGPAGPDAAAAGRGGLRPAGAGPRQGPSPQAAPEEGA